MDRLSYSYYRRSSTITTVPVFLLKGSEKNASGENICKDYYAGGSPQPGRSFNASDYRYGYQGSEKDDEITSTTGSHYTTYFRELDTRLLRWWSLDPKSSATPWESPYMTMGGNPVWWNDVLGDIIKLRGGRKKRERFLAVLNAGSTATYTYDKKKGLQVSGESADDYFATKMKEYSSPDQQTVIFRLRRGGRFIDAFRSGKVDLKDIENLNNPIIQKSAILHFTAERFELTDYEKNKAFVEDIGEFHIKGRKIQVEYYQSIMTFPTVSEGLKLDDNTYRQTVGKSHFYTDNYGTIEERIKVNHFGKVLGSELFFKKSSTPLRYHTP